MAQEISDIANLGTFIRNGTWTLAAIDILVTFHTIKYNGKKQSFEVHD